MKLTLALALLALVLVLTVPSQAVRNNSDYQSPDNSGYYQTKFTAWRKNPITFRLGVGSGIDVIGGFTPRRFADYLWDEYSSDMITRGWATQADLPETGDPYPLFKGTPYSLYQAIFNNTAYAANLTVSPYLWGMSCETQGTGNFCLNANNGWGIVPAGHYWRLNDLSNAFSSMAVGGYTQEEIVNAGLYAGFDSGLVMQALVRANSKEGIFYSATGRGDVDPNIYGVTPFIMTFQQPVWSLISTGPPSGENDMPLNPYFGTLVYGWTDALTDCGITPQGSDDTQVQYPAGPTAPVVWTDKSSASAACWKGETPSYFIVPAPVVSKIGTSKLTFIGSTTWRLIAGAAIVQDTSVIYNGGEGQENYCQMPGVNDAGCITFTQYSAYYSDIQELIGDLKDWEASHHLDLVWGGVPLEEGIPSWVSESHIISPYDASLTEAFHDPKYLQTPSNISATFNLGARYIILGPDSKTYAMFLNWWLPNYSFTRDFTLECQLLAQDYPNNAYAQQHGCDPKDTLKAFRRFIISEGVASSGQVDHEIGQGETYMQTLSNYSPALIIDNIAAHIAYLWAGCDGLCVNRYGQNGVGVGDQNAFWYVQGDIVKESLAELQYLDSASYQEYLQSFRYNNPVSNAPNFVSPFFYGVTKDYSRFLFQFPNYWTTFQAALRSCLSTGCPIPKIDPPTSSTPSVGTESTSSAPLLQTFSQTSSVSQIQSLVGTQTTFTVTTTITPKPNVTVTVNQTTIPTEQAGIGFLQPTEPQVNQTAADLLVAAFGTAVALNLFHVFMPSTRRRKRGEKDYRESFVRSQGGIILAKKVDSHILQREIHEVEDILGTLEERDAARTNPPTKTSGRNVR